PTPTPTPTPSGNPLASDGNLEMWLYQVPSPPAVADLSAGDEQPFTNLAGGTFIRVTNTDPSQLPVPGSPTRAPFIADDNHDASITDNGSEIAFGSTRDLVPGIGNAFPSDDNEEIFTYIRSSNTLNQVTKTPRGTVSNPIYSKQPSISATGNRVSFVSTGDNPIVGMSGGNNPLASRNEEVFYTDLDGSGAPTGTKKQVTVTTPTNAGDPVNIWSLGRRMSRDGRYLAFDSYADLANENGGTNYTSFALYLYDTTTSTFRRIGPRSDADTGASGGDIARYPGFTDYDGSGTPQTLVLETRENIKADGTVASSISDPNGLNADALRPTQIYKYPLNVAPSSATFTRIGRLPDPSLVLASTQLIPSDSSKRMTFNLARTELGGYNPDLLNEAFYLLVPTVTGSTSVTTSFATGASRLPIANTAAPTPTPTPTDSPTPTPTPTATPTPTPTPTATPTPTPTPSGSPTPTPTTPASVTGMSPEMTVFLDLPSGMGPSVTSRTATGSLSRVFNYPIELSGVSMTINGAACRLKSVSNTGIEFISPRGLSASLDGTVDQVVINNNGTQIKFWTTIVPARPDIFRLDNVIAPLGRAKLFNVTNRVYTTEPFTTRTVKIKGGVFVPTRLRIYVTGMTDAPAAVITVRIGSVVMTGSAIATASILSDPGVNTFDFDLPRTLDGSGDQPIIVTVTVGTATFTSRLDDTAPRVRILGNP
ncbi:MAG: hypothetical protein JO053_04390, partial [Acidobacteria bacterium]|nr:hypothetical protein [Acidobacteriota bacterium]